MKRILMMVLLILPCALYAVSFGYSLAPVGQFSGSEPYGGLTAAAILSFNSDHAGDIELSADFTPYGTFFESARIQVSLPMLLIHDHVFNALFPNPVVWSPRIGTGFQYRMGNEFNLVVGISPFAFHDKAYFFEFFSPYVLYEVLKQQWGWGIYVMKFSCFFGGAV